MLARLGQARAHVSRSPYQLEAYETAVAQGHAMSLDRAVEYALSSID